MLLVKLSKARLQQLGDNEWNSLLEEALVFCEKHEVTIPNMDKKFIALGHSRRKLPLLICVACLSPRDSLASFDKKKLTQLAKLYPDEFSSVELLALDTQLENYILDMSSNSDFDELTSIGELSKKLVKPRKHIVYPLVISSRVSIDFDRGDNNRGENIFCNEDYKK